jgi:(1->4)-alpha-D-glucan 1-alpha-D-glucosylmutase
VLERLDAGSAPRSLDEEKLLVTSRALRLRRDHPEWFGADASYAPLATTSEHALAFGRTDAAVTVATRLPVGLERRGGWGDARVSLPAGRWSDVLTGREHDGGEVSVAALLAGPARRVARRV